MTIPLLILLGALWAAVLVPPLLRARSDRRPGAIGDYAHTLGVLKSSTRATRSGSLRPAAGLVDGARHNSKPSVSNHTKKRRRDIFTGLLVACATTFILAILMGSPLLWLLQVLCDLTLGAYIYLLMQMKEQQRVKNLGSPLAGPRDLDL